MQQGKTPRPERPRTAIAVCGSGANTTSQVAEMAREVGRLVVQAGCVLVTGGLGGVMSAASEGGWQARQAGAAGLVVGILPGEQASAGNPYCEVVIPTGMGVARNVLVVRAADAVILIAGGAGTLSEAAYAWQFGKPIFALTASGGCAADLADTTIAAAKTFDDRLANPRIVVGVATAAEAVDRAVAAAGRDDA